MEALGRLGRQQRHDEALGRLRRPLRLPDSHWPASGLEKRQACAALLTGFPAGSAAFEVPACPWQCPWQAEGPQSLGRGQGAGCRQPAGVVGRGGPETLQPEEIRRTQLLQAGRGTGALDGQPEGEREPPHGGARRSDAPKRPSKRIRRCWNEPVLAEWGRGEKGEGVGKCRRAVPCGCEMPCAVWSVL